MEINVGMREVWQHVVTVQKLVGDKREPKLLPAVDAGVGRTTLASLFSVNRIEYKTIWGFYLWQLKIKKGVREA